MRNPNVQQQNATSREQIRTLAKTFRDDPLGYEWLIAALLQASLRIEQGILVQIDVVPEQEGMLFKGCWLTTQRHFISFEVMVPRREGEPIAVERWEDVTREVPMNSHLPGPGKS